MGTIAAGAERCASLRAAHSLRGDLAVCCMIGLALASDAGLAGLAPPVLPPLPITTPGPFGSNRSGTGGSPSCSHSDSPGRLSRADASIRPPPPTPPAGHRRTAGRQDTSLEPAPGTRLAVLQRVSLQHNNWACSNTDCHWVTLILDIFNKTAIEDISEVSSESNQAISGHYF